MRKAILSFVLVGASIVLLATTWGTYNGVTVGTSTGNVSSLNGVTIGTSTGNIGSFNGLTSPSGCTPASGHTYSTSFPATENPISECSSWLNAGSLGWSDIQTTTNKAFGTQNGVANDFKDSTATVVGTWGNDQQVSGIANLGTLSSTVIQEIELRARTTLASSNSTGYEYDYELDATPANCGVALVKWNGAVGSFTSIATQGGASYCVANGDTVTGRTVGTTHDMYINGIKVISATDATYSTGKPGIGTYFWLNGGSGSVSDFGFSSFRATDTPIVSVAHNSHNVSTSGTTVNTTVTTTGAGCIYAVVYWNSTSRTMTVSGSLSGAFTTSQGPTTILGTYRMQTFYKCPPTSTGSDTITATMSGSAAAIDRAIAVSAIQGVTAHDQSAAIKAGTAQAITSNTTGTTAAADEYLIGSCIFGATNDSNYALPNRWSEIENTNFGGNEMGDGIATSTGTFSFTCHQGASSTYGASIDTFK